MSATRPALAGVRVLEWGERISAPYAGLVLASLGADVLKLEPPDGDCARRRGPFPPGHEGDPEASALFHALNLGKRSEVIPSGELGGELLRERLSSTDVLITNLLAAERSTYADLDTLEDSSSLITVTITPLGEHGPLAGRPGNALTASAFGGAAIAIGSPGRPPLTLPYELADYEAGVNAAAAALLALFARQQTGEGQQVDISVAEVIASYVATNSRMYRPYGKPWMREGRRASRSGGAYPYSIFPCRDGQVALIGRTRTDWKRLLGLVGDRKWTADPRFQDPFEIADHYAEEVDRHLVEWLAEYTRDELMQIAREEGVALGPVLSVAEALEEPQFVDRGVFSRRVSVSGRLFTPPRLPWEPSLSPSLWRTARAPSLDEHAGDPWNTPPRLAPPHPEVLGETPDAPGILEGIRVLDFTWVWSGPMVGAALADFGADVIKVEHRDRLDNARLRGRPVVDGRPVDGPIEELSPYFHQNNRGKRSVTIDIKHPEGLNLCRRLAARSDIVIENLARGVFGRRGLDLAELCAENPNLIAVSMSAVGESGPLSKLRVYAPVMTGLSGMDSLVGYSDDRELGMVNLAIGDPNAASHTLVAVLAALLARERDGHGCRIDVPQVEALLAPMAEAVAQHQVAGHDPRLDAAHPAGAAPWGHYPCSGDAAWIAIAIETDAAWQELVNVLGGELRDTRYATAAARVDAAELDSLVSERSRLWERDDLTEALVKRGVAAAPVHELDELLANDHLHARGLFVDVRHPYDGSHEIARTPWELTKTPAAPRFSAPIVGQHTDEVLRDVLDLSADEISRLRESGALR